MKCITLAAVTCLLLGSAAYADRVHDWHDLQETHQHVQEAIHEMERARAANHYDMAGHGARAEQLLRDAERELHQSIEASRRAR